MSHFRKLSEELGPLLIFFLLNAYGAEWFGKPEEQGLFIATAGLMIALMIVIILTFLRGEKPKPMMLISGGCIALFGGLTILFQNENFIKLKPTIVYLTFAAILGIGLVQKKSYLQFLMGKMLSLNSTGWILLTRRWIGFFIFCALLNEIVWRHVSTDHWVSFKVFAFLPITFIFLICQIPLTKKHRLDKKN